jgi:hypothetical protein
MERTDEQRTSITYGEFSLSSGAHASMSHPPQLEVFVGFFEEYQQEFLAASSLEKRLHAAQRAIFFLSEISKDLERNGRYDQKKLCSKIQEHTNFFTKYIQSQGKEPLPNLFSINSKEMLEQLRSLWGG